MNGCKSIKEILYISVDAYLSEKWGIKQIMATTAVKRMFLERYAVSVFLEKLQPIENLPVEEKKQYWKATEEIGDVETRIDAVKVLYVLSYMASLKYETNEHPQANG